MKKFIIGLSLIFVSTLCHSQSILTFLGNQINSDLNADYNKGVKWVTFIHGSVGTPLSIGATLYIDMSDYMGITEEGKSGWVTIWLDAYAGVGLPFGIGCIPREYDLNEPDSAPYFFSKAGAISTPGLKLIDYSEKYDFESGSFEIDGLEFNRDFRFEVGIGYSLSVISLEVKKEFLDIFFSSVFLPNSKPEEYANNINNSIGSFVDEISWKNILKFPVRMTTPQDSQNDFLITSVDFSRLAINQWGKVLVSVRPRVSDGYQVGIWNTFGLPPAWKWEDENSIGVPYQQSYITANQTKVFFFNVKPTSSKARFSFRLYQDKGLWDFIQSVDYPFDVHALPEGTDVIGPKVVSTVYDHQNNKLKIIFNENIDKYTFNKSTVFLYDSKFNFLNYNFDFISDKEVHINLNQTFCNENIVLYITSYIYDLNGNRLDQNQDGLVGPFYDFSFNVSNCVKPALSSGQVSPNQGTTTDSYYFSVNYKDESGNSPQAVSLKINGYTMPMDLESGTINTGAIYSLSYANSTSGTYNYYFEATTADGEALRLPASGYLQLTISESTAGWEMIAYSIDATPNYMLSAKSVSVTAEILNMSNSSDKIYYNLPYTFEMFGPSGNLEAQKSGTIVQANKGSILKVQTSLTPNNINGSHQIVFTVYPNKDNDFSNNSKSIPIIIGSDGPTREYHISNDWAWVWMDVNNQTVTFNGHSYTLTDVRSDYITVRQDGGSYDRIYSQNFCEYNSYTDVLINEAVNTYGNLAAMISFGKAVTNYVVFESTNISGYPGDRISFFATSKGSSFSSSDPHFYNNTYIDDWFYNTYVTNSGKTGEYKFSLPSNATPGVHKFYIGVGLGSLNEKLLKELIITVLAPPPSITSLSKTEFCPGDVLTITGKNFGTTGTVRFNGISATQINSWSSTSIQCIVPPGIENGNVYVVNSAGTSNGFSYKMGIMQSPAEVAASDGIYCDKVQITWTEVTGATGYNVYIGDELITGNLTAASYDDYNATSQVTSYSVTALGNCGESVKVSDTGYRDEVTAPVSFVNVTDGYYCDKVVINWESVNEAISYNLFRGDQKILSETIETSFEDYNAPTSETTYYVTVVGKCGESTQIGDIGYKAPETTAPANVQASDGTYCDRVVITWNGVQNATSYNVYKGTTQIVSNITSTVYEDYDASTDITTYYVSANGFCGESSKQGDTGFKCENACEHDWSIVSYTNSTTAYCKVTIEGISASADDKLGAFVGEECRGIGDIVIDSNNAYSTILIQGDAIETVKFKVWDANECLERDVCGSWQSNPGGNIGYPPDYLITDVCTNLTQPISLNSGWNLKSFYVNTETGTPAELFGGLACNILQVKNMTKSWDPAIADFLNTLKVLTPGEGYFIKSEFAGNFDVSGPYAGSDHCLNLTTGWNLIGYPYDICQEITTAFGDLISSSQLIQVKNMTQSYDPAVADFLNTLKYLEPGEGYFLKVNSNNSCYIVPEPTIYLKSEQTQDIAECGWEFTGYEKSTVAYGEVTLNDLPVNGKAFIGAFVGDECRAVVPLTNFEEKSYASMVINGLKEEKVTFKLCSNGNIYESDTKITSKPDGTITDIIPIAFNAEANLKVQPQLRVHPNPFSENLNITVHLSKPDDIDIAVYGADSRLIHIFQKDNTTAGQHLFEWDATDLNGNSCAPGMYFIHFKGKTGNAVEKVILNSKN